MRLYQVAAGAALLCLASLSSAQSYKIVNRWRVGGTGGWDYLLSDDAAHRLYIAHNARVEVLDTATGKPVGAITGLKSTHGIALNPNGKNGYISDGAGNAIIVFDRATLSITQTVAAGTNPDGITYEPKTNTVWAFNGRSKDVSVLDATTNQVVATIPLPGKPEFPQVDSNGNVFVNIEDKNSIVRLDAREKSITATWNLTGCESPSGMAIDKTGKRLFSVCDGNKMSLLDYSIGKLLGLASIGDSPDAAGFDPKTGYVFSSNGGDGTLTVIDTNQPGFPQVQSLATARGAKTMAFDASTGKIYLGAAQYAPPAAPTAAIPKPRPAILPDSFEVIVVSR